MTPSSTIPSTVAASISSTVATSISAPMCSAVMVDTVATPDARTVAAYLVLTGRRGKQNVLHHDKS